MIGKTISHYRITEIIGEGGMGVVYKALDTTLDRHVAIKFLPPHLHSDNQAKTRFVHEAKAASALNHANIAVVHEIDETLDGQMFIVMAFYEGQTLKGKIEGGPLDIDDAIAIVSQLASGLGKAHEKNILHRDIKPANILMGDDGHAKLADFGLAKLAGRTQVTKTGTTLGTVAYMSPEQASGGDVDHRSDIFSLGVVFYELLTGALPFKGDHEAAIIYGIINNTPEPLKNHRNDISDGLQQVVDTVLEKEPGKRFQTTRELIEALGDLGWDMGTRRHRATGAGSALRGRTYRVVRWLVAVAAVAAVAVLAVNYTMRPPTPDSYESASATHTQLTFMGHAKDPIISPDGQFVAYLSEISGSEKELLVRDIGGGEPIVLLDAITDYFTLRWSPDSSKLVLVGDRRGEGFHIFIMPRLGGSVRQLEYIRPYVAWSPDGGRLAATAFSLKQVWFVDVSTEKVDDHALDLEFPFSWLPDLDWSPDGSRLALHVIDAQESGHEIWTVGINGGDPVRVVSEPTLSSPRWAPSGNAIYYVVPRGATQALYRVGIDPRSGEATGDPAILLSGVTGLGPLAFSNDGKGLAYARHLIDKDLWLFSTDEEREEGVPVSRRLTTGTAVDDWPSVSPDGNEVAFVRIMGEATNIFVVPSEGGPARQVTFMDSRCVSPVWSPDGREIAFTSYENGKGQVWKMSAGGGGPRVFENTLVGESGELAWAPNERILYETPGGRNVTILDPVSGDLSALLENEDAGYLSVPVISPDQKFAATCWNRSKNQGVWLISMLDSVQSPLSAIGNKLHKHPIGWSGDGQWIYYMNMQGISRVRSDGDEDEVVLTIPVQDVGTDPHFAMSPGAKYLVVGVIVKTPSDIWLVENFDPDVR